MAEDHNQLGIGRLFVVTFVWRPPSAVAGDRNYLNVVMPLKVKLE